METDAPRIEELTYQSSGRVRRVVKNSAIISGFNGLGFATALLIDMVITARFGLGRETDAFFIAFSVPQLIASILLVAPNVALVPIFAKMTVDKDRSGLWRLVSNLINLSFLGMGIVGLLGILSAPLLVSVVGAGLDPITRQLAIALSPWLFLMVVPLGANEVLKAALNALQSFAFPAATTVVRNVVTFLAVVCFGEILGIQVLVWGYVAAAWVQFGFLVGALFFTGFKYRWILNTSDVQTQEALRRFQYPLMGTFLGQSNVLFERFFASFLPGGMISALVYARRVLRAVESIFVGSITTALLPRLSREAAEAKPSEFRDSLALGVKLTTILALPVALGIIALDVPIVQLLFQRGAFDSAAVQTTAQLLALYILAIPTDAIQQLFMASYYATGDTQNPFYIRLLLLGSYLFLDCVLFWGFGATGLALGYTFSKLIVALVSGWLVFRRVQGFLDSTLSIFLLKVSVASAMMLGVVLWVRRVGLDSWGEMRLEDEILRVGVGMCIGVIVYGLSLVGLRVKEISRLFSVVRQQLMRGKL